MNIFIMQNSIVKPLGRDMQNVLIGFVGEHEARTFFVRTRDDLTGYTVGLVIDDVDCGAMTKAPMPDGSIMLSLTLTSDMLGKGGDKVCQLLMTKDTIVRKSSQFRAYVGASNDINSTAPDSATIIIISEKITELVHEAALDAIAEVQEVIDSIPADYSALSAQVDTNTEDIGGLKADLDNLEPGLSDTAKAALLACFDHVAWDDDDPTGQTYITALYNALYPPADLVSISAVYTQSDTVYDTDTLNSLKSDLVVTALMSDQTTRPVIDYTLSGTLTEGTSTITVTYGGKTATFNVTVTEDLSITWDYTMGLPNANGFTLAQSENGSPSATLEADGVQMVLSGPKENYIRYEYSTPTPNGVFEFQVKSGSDSNLNMTARLATDSSGNGIGVRMQYSNGYKGIYLITGDAISSMTLLKTMALNTVYTVKFVVNSGLVDVYVDNEKLAEGVPVNSIFQNTATYFRLGSSSSTTASVNCKLMSMSIRV